MSSDIAKGVIEKLKEENAVLRAEVNVTRQNYEEYKTENITLRDDGKRLDWILSHAGGSWIYWQMEMCLWEPDEKASRAAIDLARKEAQQ